MLLLQRCTAFDPVSFCGGATNLLLNCLWTHLFELNAAEFFLQSSTNDSVWLVLHLRTYLQTHIQLYIVHMYLCFHLNSKVAVAGSEKRALWLKRQRWMIRPKMDHWLPLVAGCLLRVAQLIGTLLCRFLVVNLKHLLVRIFKADMQKTSSKTKSAFEFTAATFSLRALSIYFALANFFSKRSIILWCT